MAKKKNDLLKKIDNPEIKKDVAVIKEKDPLEKIRVKSFNFLSSIMENIDGVSEIQKLILQKYKDKLENEDLSIQEITGIYNVITELNNSASESILQMFKPVPGNPSPLVVGLLKGADEDDIDSFIKNMSDTDKRKIDTLYRRLIDQNEK